MANTIVRAKNNRYWIREERCVVSTTPNGISHDTIAARLIHQRKEQQLFSGETQPQKIRGIGFGAATGVTLPVAKLQNSIASTLSRLCESKSPAHTPGAK